jgi:hypothetical protein
MRQRVQTVLALGCAALLAAGGIAATALATAPQQRGPWADWSTLRLYVKSGLFLSGRVEMQLERGPDGTVLETSTTARFLGAKLAQSWTRTLLDPATGRSERYESQSKKRGRVYVFGPDGYVVEKLRPGKDGSRSGEDWEVYWRHEYAYPVAEDGKPFPVFDYYGMLLQLRRSALHAPGDEVLLHVATSSGPKPFRIRVGDSVSAPQSFTDLQSGEKRTLEVQMLRLRVIPADPGENDEGFLKMEGETELWVEAGSKAILLLSGNAPKIPGRIKLVLREIG